MTGEARRLLVERLEAALDAVAARDGARGRRGRS
jgi:hypothetical protein